MISAVPRVSSFFDPLIAEAKQRMRRRRLLVAALLMAVIVGASGATLALRGSGGSPSSGLSSHSLAIGALRLSAPSRFYVRTIRDGRHGGGTLVTDYRVTTDSPTIREAVFPADAVLLSVGRAVPSLPLHLVPPLRLPLTLAELGRAWHRTDGTAWTKVFRYRGYLYPITFWAGRNAASSDQEALTHTLLSIHSSR